MYVAAVVVLGSVPAASWVGMGRASYSLSSIASWHWINGLVSIPSQVSSRTLVLFPEDLRLCEPPSY